MAFGCRARALGHTSHVDREGHDREAVFLPPGLMTERAAPDSPEARWLRSVPGIVQNAADQWHLDVDDGEPMHGGFAVVVPVHRDGEACVLKISQLTEAVAAEALALSAWDGQGAVRLLDADPGAGVLLLERLNPRRTLYDLPWPAAAHIAAVLLRRLASVAAPPGVPSLHRIAETLANDLPERNERAGGPVPKPYLDAATGLAREIGPVAGDQLIHADLHYGNVLAGDREPWLAIDPRAVAGDPEHAVPELLWARLDEVGGSTGLWRLLAIVVAEAGLDLELARSWTIVRCVDFWLWALDNGLTGHPRSCQRIIEILAGGPA
jgi:streptomycin 6-kinase